jgi:uncharacterized damage-inducible protein DinB
MKKNTLILFCSFVIASLSNTVASQAITGDSIKAQMLRDWQRAKSYTADYLKTMPADQYAKHPIDSIRSFSEQMLHTASGIIGHVSVATGQTRIYPGFNMEKSPTAQSKDSVSYYVNASYDFALNAISSFDPNKLGEMAKRGNANFTRYTWLLKAFEHQTHHRGQCTIYIRLLGIKPPNEQLY